LDFTIASENTPNTIKIIKTLNFFSSVFLRWVLSQNQDLPCLTRYTLGSAIRSKFQEKIPLFLHRESDFLEFGPTYTGYSAKFQEKIPQFSHRESETSWSLALPTQATGPCRCGLQGPVVRPHPHRVPGLIGVTSFQEGPILVGMSSFQKVPLNPNFPYTKRGTQRHHKCL